jgi:hypothetical protein
LDCETPHSRSTARSKQRTKLEVGDVLRSFPLGAQHNPAETLNLEPVRYEQRLNLHVLGLSDDTDLRRKEEHQTTARLAFTLLDLISRAMAPARPRPDLQLADEALNGS